MRLRLNWFAALLTAMSVYFVYALVQQHWQLTEIDRNYAVAQERLRVAQERNEQLKAERARMDDPVYIEKVAREELGLTRQGETPYLAPR